MYIIIYTPEVNMSKKEFYATIPMLPKENLKKLKYRKEDIGEIYSCYTHFPAIAMIEGNVTGNDEVAITVIMTDDVNHNSESNLELFKAELQELSDEMGVPMKVDNIIVVPHNESKSKHIYLFKTLCKSYEEAGDIYFDVTYGTKCTSIALFSSLTYAEKVCGCGIESVIYGNYAFNDSDIGNLFEIKALYNLNSIIQELETYPMDTVTTVMENLWDE